MLTVKNIDAWCSVSINGGTASAAASQTACVSGTVTLVAMPASSEFELGTAPWHDTNSTGTITGTGVSAKATTTVNVSGATQCAWVCCPFTDGSGCNVTDPCS
jgi:hypothetical protein